MLDARYKHHIIILCVYCLKLIPRCSLEQFGRLLLRELDNGQLTNWQCDTDTVPTCVSRYEERVRDREERAEWNVSKVTKCDPPVIHQLNRLDVEPHATKWLAWQHSAMKNNTLCILSCPSPLRPPQCEIIIHLLFYLRLHYTLLTRRTGACMRQILTVGQWVSFMTCTRRLADGGVPSIYWLFLCHTRWLMSWSLTPYLKILFTYRITLAPELTKRVRFEWNFVFQQNSWIGSPSDPGN